jgi:putative spermidine/putrescine transport system substrate-binding protein
VERTINVEIPEVHSPDTGHDGCGKRDGGGPGPDRGVFRRANKAAQVKAFYAPWEAAGNGKIVAGEYNGEMAKVKAMVDTKSVSWDLVEVESPELSRGCDEDMFEQLDPALFGKAEDYVKGAIQPCGVGFFVWSTVLAYNADKLKTAPTSWADFWDTSNSQASAACARAPSTPWNSP